MADYYITKMFAERDAMMYHYISLHPEDFDEEPPPKLKHVLYPWYPVREHVSPILSIFDVEVSSQCDSHMSYENRIGLALIPLQSALQPLLLPCTYLSNIFSVGRHLNRLLMKSKMPAVFYDGLQFASCVALFHCWTSYYYWNMSVNCTVVLLRSEQ